MNVVIIGGVAGGASAAARIRRLDEHAQIDVYERSGYISYANCGLPYYVGGVIENKEDLTLQTPESFYSRFGIHMHVRHEVTDIDPTTKTVTVKNLETGEVFRKPYDKLLLSPGARPVIPPFARVETDRLFTLRTVEDTLKIREYADREKPATAIVIGGGFIGMEVAENLRHAGLQVTLVEAAPQLMAPFDEDMAAYIHAQVRHNGIDLRLQTFVEGLEPDEKEIRVRLKGGQVLSADMAVLAIGVMPETTLAKKAGLALGVKDSIVVNERMETSVPDIYAAGDAVQIRHFVSGQDGLISLAGPANKQGRVAADNICGKQSRYTGAQGSSILKLFDMTAASTGLNVRTARSQGLDADFVVVSGMNHAGYYPGGRMMTMKVVFEKGTYRLLGAQIIGYEGVDKRIDVLATAIRARMKGYELTELDLAYAPPYSSAKDPVNMAGFIMENIRDGIIRQWHYGDEVPEEAIMLDTRTDEEYSQGHAEGFVHIPVDELRGRLDELDRNRPVYVMCQSGLRSYIACRILVQEGFDARNFAGGYGFYQALHSEKALPCGKVMD